MPYLRGQYGRGTTSVQWTTGTPAVTRSNCESFSAGYVYQIQTLALPVTVNKLGCRLVVGPGYFGYSDLSCSHVYFRIRRGTEEIVLRPLSDGEFVIDGTFPAGTYTWEIVFSDVNLSCQDERTYTDQYLITLTGWDKLGNAFTLTKTVTFRRIEPHWLFSC